MTYFFKELGPCLWRQTPSSWSWRRLAGRDFNLLCPCTRSTCTKIPLTVLCVLYSSADLRKGGRENP